jgi:hypothetical protein
MSLKSKIFIFLGIYSLLGISLVKKLIFLYNYAAEGINLLPIDFFEIFVFVIAFIFVILALITSLILAKRNKKIVSKKIKAHVLLPLFIGFIIIFLLMVNNLHVIVSVSLIIYGIILLNLTRITIDKYNILGLAEIFLAIVSVVLSANSLIYLTLGFGIFPILFGLYNYRKV